MNQQQLDEPEDGDNGTEDIPPVRHRTHRFPARTRTVKVRYDEQEYGAVATAAARARLTPSGFLASCGLTVAGAAPPPSQALDRELLSELMHSRTALRRYAVNLNQAVAALNSSGQAPMWLQRVVAGADRAVRHNDEATLRISRRPS